MSESLISLYKERLGLPQATFNLIDHEETMVATVFKITQPNERESILKICPRQKDYLREVYFLTYFSKKLPVPRIIQLVQPEGNLPGAILMECLPGKLLASGDLNNQLSYEIGSFLARIHLERVKGYGDLTDPDNLSTDPRIPFSMKFEEGLEECKKHLPRVLLEKSRRYFDEHVNLLTTSDGPCMIHRDFRPGNLFVNHGKIQGIIDWSSARGGCAEEDFCPLEFGE
jgi:Ser/Thr protein kinase RdoA (MazF antagonist)